MLETKIFEIRDRSTFFVVYATRADAAAFNLNTQEEYLLQRDGFSAHIPLVILCRSKGNVHYEPYGWGDRTYMAAHAYIADNWNALTSGDLIDVQHILGETKEPKQSERITNKDLY